MLAVLLTVETRGQHFDSGTLTADSCKVTRAYVLCLTDTTQTFARIFRGCSDGSLIEYYPDGKARSAFTSVANGTDKISLEWFERGLLKSERVDRGNNSAGYYKEWFASGRLKIDAELRDGRIHGRCMEWNDFGELVRDEDYREGKLRKSRIKGAKL